MYSNTGDVVAAIWNVSGKATAGDQRARAELTAMTNQLAALRMDALDEYLRYRELSYRRLRQTPSTYSSPLAGRRIVVTGGTGTIGSALIRRLTLSGAASITSVSRGVRSAAHLPDGVEVARCDVRDRERLATVMMEARPEIVFHLAAERDPGAAERDPSAAVTTNVAGTRFVLESAVRSGASRFVYASTGKAVRFFTTETYAASKRVAEYTVATRRGAIDIHVARFTHVVDNSILHANLLNFMRDGSLQIYSPTDVFHAQSAGESAELLVRGLLNTPDDVPKMYSMRSLDPWFSTLDLALGLRKYNDSNAWLAFAGSPAGYKSELHASLYDHVTASDTGILVNAVEALSTHGIDNDELNLTIMNDRCSPDVESLLAALEHQAITHGDVPNGLLDDISRAILAHSFEQLERVEVDRLLELRATGRPSSHPDNLVVDRILDGIVRYEAG